MALDGVLEELVRRLKADAAEESLGRSLWSALAGGLKVGANGAVAARDVSLIEEVVVCRIVALQMMKALGEGPLFSSKDQGAGAEKVSIHPAFDALAKSQERQRKVMKELMERLDAAAGGEVQGLPDLMVPILEKAQGVLEYALEPREGTDETGGGGARKRRN